MKHLVNTLNWIKKDYASHPFRFTIEFIAWLITIGCSVVMAMTVPNPPLFELYMVFLIYKKYLFSSHLHLILHSNHEKYHNL